VGRGALRHTAHHTTRPSASQARKPDTPALCRGPGVRGGAGSRARPGSGAGRLRAVVRPVQRFRRPSRSRSRSWSC